MAGRLSNKESLYVIFWCFSFLVLNSSDIGMAHPVKSSLPISVLLKRGDSHRKFEEERGRVFQCIPVDSADIPTTIQISSNKVTGAEEKLQNQYELVTYSSKCDDEHSINQDSLEVEQPIILNDRYEICSFKLVKAPWSDLATTVKFLTKSRQNPVYKTFNISDNRCIDLCSGSVANENTLITQYPFTVILEENGHLANNFVHLFSNRGCADDGQIRNKNNNSFDIENGADLVQLTMKSSTTAVKYFSITEKRLYSIELSSFK